MTHQGAIAMEEQTNRDDAATPYAGLSDLVASQREDRIAILQDLLDAMEDGAALWDEDLHFVVCNDRYRELVFPPGFRKLTSADTARDFGVEVFGSGLFVLPDNIDAQTMADQVIAFVKSYIPEMELRRADGRILRAAAKKTGLGGYLITATEITAQHKITETARQTMVDALQSLDEGMVLFDRDSRFVYGNEAYYRFFYSNDRIRPKIGDTADHILRQDILDGLYRRPPNIAFEDFFQLAMSMTQTHGKKHVVELSDGRQLIACSQETQQGGFLMSFTDVTDVSTSEMRVRALFQDAIEALDQAIAVLDKNAGFIFANRAWHDMWLPKGPAPTRGETPSQIVLRQLAMNPQYYAVPEGQSHQDFADGLTAILKTDVKDYEMPMGDGRVIVGSVHKTELGGFLVAFNDVTEKRREEERRLEAVNDALNAADYPMVLFDANRRFVLANEAAYTMFDAAGVKPKPGEDGIAFFRQTIDNGYYSLPPGMSKDDMMRNGTVFVESYGRDFPLQTSDGKTFLGSSTKTALGGYLISFRDITAQNQVQEELAQQREIAHQNEKLSALGELLAGVAHELNNPLSVVFGYSQMLQGKVSDPVLAERVDLICQSAERAAKIVKTFLAMARQRPTKIERYSINDIVATALEVSSYSLKTNGTQVITLFDAADPVVSGDFDQLVQVFSNLLINAGHAVETKREAGTITIKTSLEPRTGETVVEVSDNGPGIPADLQKRIFEPFFTTKDVGEGTGVGLAFSRRIVHSHGGSLELVSRHGQGATFYVRFDSAQQAAGDAEKADGYGAIAGVNSVLVVDDEAGVAQLVSDMLREEGLCVTTTTSPRDALRLAEAQSFDVVLSDFKMPDMDGRAFYDVMKNLSPNTAARMGFVTGDALSGHVADFFAQSGRPHIEKPIIKSDLLGLLRRATQAKEGAL
ncbi:MAG: PAS-domain containing protein [Pseudomonadota bacterium]